MGWNVGDARGEFEWLSDRSEEGKEVTRRSDLNDRGIA